MDAEPVEARAARDLSVGGGVEVNAFGELGEGRGEPSYSGRGGQRGGTG
jgi:hypothetical protein